MSDYELYKLTIFLWNWKANIVILKLTWINFQFALKLSWFNINNLKNICFLTNKSLLNSSYACWVDQISEQAWMVRPGTDVGGC